MAKVRETYWIPRLRQITKRVRGRCWGCKKFRVKAYQSPPPGTLPSTRTKGSTPFEVLGVDFACQIRYHTKGRSGSSSSSTYPTSGGERAGKQLNSRKEQ
ncbi:Hypothetical predicted protein [Paramuricea clavata]|uniref:Uncharacterized protein n=1 Tax=Paramuricea clavata TaxID=317549 RepID=A0A6S7G7Y3_PARCT|nr:Hypothetical predicted protein [Paramuricea clavata]